MNGWEAARAAAAAQEASTRPGQAQVRVDRRWRELMELAELGQLNPGTFAECQRLLPKVSPELLARFRGPR